MEKQYELVPRMLAVFFGTAGLAMVFLFSVAVFKFTDAISQYKINEIETQTLAYEVADTCLREDKGQPIQFCYAACEDLNPYFGSSRGEQFNSLCRERILLGPSET